MNYLTLINIRKAIVAAIFFLTPICIGIIVSQYYLLNINTSPSLPHTLLLVEKGTLPSRVGDLIVYKIPGNERFGDVSFLKRVGGMPNDEVMVISNVFLINGIYLCTAKNKDSEGNPVELTPEGMIPKGQYFVYTTHPDSYDSKYKEVGFIDSRNVIGVAHVIF